MFRKFGAMFLVATLVTSACGGGTDSNEDGAEAPVEIGEDQPTPDIENNDDEGALERPNDFVSTDGKFRISPPGDGTEVTIEAVDASLDPGPLAEAVQAYQLGPDGATFDPPLRAMIEMTDEQVARGVAVVHVTAAGDAESIDTVLVDGGVAFDLSSFSAIEVFSLSAGFTPSAPSIALVDEPFTIYGTADRDAFTIPAATSPVTVFPPISVSGDEYVCTEPGVGSMSHNGEIAVASRLLAGLFFTYRYMQVEFEHTIKCVAPPVTVPPTDTQCANQNPDSDLANCPDFAELAIGFSLSEDELVVTVHDTPGWATTVAVGQGDPDVRSIEFSKEETRAFGGPVFLGYTLTETDDGPYLSALDTVLVLEGLVAIEQASGLLEISLPGGVAADGTIIEDASGPLTNITIFLEKDDVLGVYYYETTTAFTELFGS